MKYCIVIENKQIYTIAKTLPFHKDGEKLITKLIKKREM